MGRFLKQDLYSDRASVLCSTPAGHSHHVRGKTMLSRKMGQNVMPHGGDLNNTNESHRFVLSIKPNACIS